MKTRSIFIAFAIVALSLFSLTLPGCETVHEAREDQPRVQAGGDSTDVDGGSCDYGASRSFDLSPTNPPAGLGEAPHFSYALSTTGFPYSRRNCVCNVAHYDFIFDSVPTLPKIPNVEVKDAHDNEVPFEYVDDNEPLQTIRVGWQDAWQNEEPEVHIRWLNPNYSIDLDRASGLCVIDNLDGDWEDPQNTLIISFPWVLKQAPQWPWPDSIINILIPTYMTTGP